MLVLAVVQPGYSSRHPLALKPSNDLGYSREYRVTQQRMNERVCARNRVCDEQINYLDGSTSIPF